MVFFISLFDKIRNLPMLDNNIMFEFNTTFVMAQYVDTSIDVYTNVEDTDILNSREKFPFKTDE